MSPRDFIFAFLRHCASAAAVFLVFLVALERIAPTSVLPYFSPFAWAMFTLVLLVMAATPVAAGRVRGWGLLLPAAALCAWLLLILPQQNRSTWFLVLACAMLGVSAAWGYAQEKVADDSTL